MWKESSQTQYWPWSVPQLSKAHNNYTDEGTSPTRRFHRGTKLAFSWPFVLWVLGAWSRKREWRERGWQRSKSTFVPGFCALHSYEQHMRQKTLWVRHSIIPIIEMRKLRMYNHHCRARIEPQAHRALPRGTAESSIWKQAADGLGSDSWILSPAEQTLSPYFKAQTV